MAMHFSCEGVEVGRYLGTEGKLTTIIIAAVITYEPPRTECMPCAFLTTNPQLGSIIFSFLQKEELKLNKITLLAQDCSLTGRRTCTQTYAHGTPKQRKGGDEIGRTSATAEFTRPRTT